MIQTLAPILFILVSIAPLLSMWVEVHPRRPHLAPLWIVLKAMNLCFASTVISITSVLNFSLAMMLAIFLGVPLATASAHKNVVVNVLRYLFYTFLAQGWLLLASRETWLAVRDWQAFGVWFAPLVCLVYVPLVLQAGIVCLLSP